MSNLNKLARSSIEEFPRAVGIEDMVRLIQQPGYYEDPNNLYYGLGAVDPTEKEATTRNCQTELRALQRIVIAHLVSNITKEVQADQHLKIARVNANTIYAQLEGIKEIAIQIKCPQTKTYYLSRALGKHQSPNKYLIPNYAFSDEIVQNKVTGEEFFEGLKNLKISSVNQIIKGLETDIPLLVLRYKLLTPLYSTINQATMPDEELISGLGTAIYVIQNLFQFLHEQFPETRISAEEFLKKIESAGFDSFLKRLAGLNIFSASPYISNSTTNQTLPDLLTLTKDGILDIVPPSKEITRQVNRQVLNSLGSCPHSIREQTTGCPALHSKKHSPDKTGFSDFLQAIAESYAKHVLPLPSHHELLKNF